MADVNMPKLSDTMEEGTVLEWKKQDGQEVRRGEVLAEIESDKASFEIESEADGGLHVAVQRGQPVPVGQLIGRIGGEAPEQATEPAGRTPPQTAAATEGPADAASAPAEAAPAAERPAPADEPEPERAPAPRHAPAAAAPEPARPGPSGNGAE